MIDLKNIVINRINPLVISRIIIPSTILLGYLTYTNEWNKYLKCLFFIFLALAISVSIINFGKFLCNIFSYFNRNFKGNYFVVGMAGIITILWYTTNLRIPGSYSIILIVIISALVAIFNKKNTDFKIEKNYLYYIFISSLLYLYSILRINSGDFEFTTYFNEDPINYSIISGWIFNGVNSVNVVGYNFFKSNLYFYEGTPVSFYLIQYVSIFTAFDQINASMPSLYLVILLFCTISHKIITHDKVLSNSKAIIIVTFVLFTPLLRYIYTNYFISQLLGLSAVIYLALLLIKKGSIHNIRVIVFTTFFFVFFTYPPYIPVYALILSSYLLSEYIKNYKNLFLIIKFAGVFFIPLCVLLLFYDRTNDIYNLLTQFKSKDGLNWWGTGFIPLSYTLGMPNVELGRPGDMLFIANAFKYKWPLFFLLTLCLGLFPILRSRKINNCILFLFLSSLFLYISYLVIWSINGFGYQQWKYNSYISPILIIFIILLIYLFINGIKNLSLKYKENIDFIIITMLIVILISNILIFTNKDKKFIKYSLINLNLINELKNYKYIYLYSNNFALGNLLIYRLPGVNFTPLSVVFYNIKFNQDKGDWIGEPAIANLNYISEKTPLLIRGNCSNYGNSDATSFVDWCLIRNVKKYEAFEELHINKNYPNNLLYLNLQSNLKLIIKKSIYSDVFVNNKLINGLCKKNSCEYIINLDHKNYKDYYGGIFNVELKFN